MVLSDYDVMSSEAFPVVEHLLQQLHPLDLQHELGGQSRIEQTLEGVGSIIPQTLLILDVVG